MDFYLLHSRFLVRHDSRPTSCRHFLVYSEIGYRVESIVSYVYGVVAKTFIWVRALLTRASIMFILWNFYFYFNTDKYDNSVLATLLRDELRTYSQKS